MADFPKETTKERKHKARISSELSSAQREEIMTAKIVSYSKKHKLVYAWYGGTSIHAYDRRGKEVNHFNLSSNTGHADPEEVRKAIRSAMRDPSIYAVDEETYKKYGGK